jgi:hypothetical protein
MGRYVAASGSDVKRCDRCGNRMPVWGTLNGVSICYDCERNLRSASEHGDRMARQITAVFDRERATRELMATLRATLAGIASCSTCEVCREAARNAHALAEAWE